MADTEQMNLNVLKVTKARVARIADMTHRGKGDVVDLAIEKLWEELNPQVRFISGPGQSDAELQQAYGVNTRTVT